MEMSKELLKIIHGNIATNSMILIDRFQLHTDEFKDIVLMTTSYMKLIDPSNASIMLAQFCGSVAMNTNEELIGAKFIILLDDTCAINAPQDMMRAVIYHELGHLRLGHTELPSFDLEGNVVLDSDTMKAREIEADNYSVKHGFGSSMIEFLRLFLDNEDIRELVNVPQIEYRIDAMENHIRD